MPAADAERLAGVDKLPAHWVWARLGDVADVIMGNSPPGSSYNTSGIGLPLINGPTEFGPGPLDHPNAVQYTNEPTRTCLPGDLLICVRGSTTGRTNVASFEACIGRGVAAIRAFEAQPYLNHYIWSRSEALLAISSGSTFPNISLAQLQSLAVPLPPVSEQARIVSTLERNLNDIAKGLSSLSLAAEDLTRLRASVLQAAFTGKLTEKSRKAIGRGRTPRLPTSTLAFVGTPGSRRPRQTSLFEDVPAEPLLAEARPPLPSGWRWTTFGATCDIRLGRSKSPSNRAGKYSTPYLRAANITDDGLDLTDVKSMDFPPREREVYRLRIGDLLVAEASGSSAQVGKPAIWNEELKLCCYQNTVIRLRPIEMNGDFVLALLQHCYFNGVFAGLSAGVGINHLGASRLSEIAIPLPSRAEQARIAKEVKAQLSAISASRITIERTLQQAVQLRRSLWKKAFSGELVPPRKSTQSALSLVDSMKLRRQNASLATANPPRRNRQTSMRQKTTRTPLLDILIQHPDGIRPEQLLLLGGYTNGEVDDFYAALSKIADNVLEEKPQGEAVFGWPKHAHTLLRAKGK